MNDAATTTVHTKRLEGIGLILRGIVNKIDAYYTTPQHKRMSNFSLSC